MDPFATLGLARRYDLDPNELERRYRELQKALHPDRHVGASASQRRMALGKAVEVNEAYRTLRDQQKRAEALLALLRGADDKTQAPVRETADPALLMEVMELREALSEAKLARDMTRVGSLAERVRALHARTDAELLRAFGELSEHAQPGQLQAISAQVSRLKYYQRFLDEVSAFEETA
jgi:molecular chaperone HscB